MTEKQIPTTKTMYESIDGKEFDTEYAAKKHNCIVYFQRYMADRYCEVMDTGFCIINSKEESEILQTLSTNGFTQKGFFVHYLTEEEFPTLVKFKDEFANPTNVVTETDYKWFKDMAERFQTLCKMYELANSNK